jgi:hypothetical protein
LPGRRHSPLALKGSQALLADKDLDSPVVDNVLTEHCTFGDSHGVVTLGSEASTVRNVTAPELSPTRSHEQ